VVSVWVGGVGLTPFGRSGRGPETLACEAVAAALADANIGPAVVQQVFLGNAAAGLLSGQEMIRAQVFLDGSGLAGVPMVNVENACASSSSAFSLAVTAVRAGMVDVALAVGVERMAVPDRARTFGALAAGTDTVRRPEMRAIVGAMTLGERGADPPLSASVFMDHYAQKAIRYLKDSGGEEADLARVVVKSRAFAAHNPGAQLRAPTTVDEVLAGRMIAEPLRLSMCAPIGDGAAAVVVMSDSAAAQHKRRGVRVASIAMTSSDPSALEPPATRAAAAAYDAAGVGPDDIDVVEVHDAAAPAELICLEELGLCRRGDALALLRDGATGPGGRLPVNTGGGLLSRGHPVGATGCAQLVELANQLRGRHANQVPRARLALAQNSGGILGDHEAVAVVTILERV
jgi:acetyl-CoA acetyltransferase